MYPVDQAIALHAEAVRLRGEGRARDALAPCRQALSILERECGSAHPDVACVLLVLGALHEDLSAFTEAEAAYRRADEVLDGYSRESDPALVRLRVQARARRGGIARALDRLEQAELYFLQAIELADRQLGHHDAVLVPVLTGLGFLHRAAGRFPDAERVYQRALGIAEPASVDVADIERGLARLDHDRGFFESGIAHARRAVDLRSAVVGADHVSVAVDVAALAELVEAAGRLDEAEALYQRSLAVLERVRGPEHLEVAVNLHNLGALSAARGDADDAERRYRRALEIKEQILGRDHPDVASTLRGLGRLLADRGRVDDAVALLYRAHDVFEEAYGPNHASTVATAEDIAALT